MPKVSVIMPAYNAEKYIKEAIDSILGQTFPDFELIILDDCSKDMTGQIIQSYRDERIIYVRNEENLRVARTLNKGLQIARGEYIARMDADDSSFPDRLAKQVAYLDCHPEIAVLGTNVELFDENGVIGTGWSATNPEQMKVDLFFSCGLAHPSVMMRKSVILELGGYHPEFEGLEDYELWCRVSEKYAVTTLPDLLFRYRIHGGQVTKNPSPEYVQRMRCLQEWKLQRLGLPVQGKSAEIYHRICAGAGLKTKEEVLDAAALFDEVLAANRNVGMYPDALLKNAFCGILLSAAAGLKSAERKEICRKTGLVSGRKLAGYLAKQKLKGLLSPREDANGQHNRSGM